MSFAKVKLKNSQINSQIDYWLTNEQNSPLAIVQSILLIAGYLFYLGSFSPILLIGLLGIATSAYSIAVVSKNWNYRWNYRIKPWQIILAVLIIGVVIFHDSIVHAQMFEDAKGELDKVQTAAGNNFDANVVDAVIAIFRISLYVAIAGAVMVAIFFGVAQNQWQTPVLVVSIIVAVGMFLQIMGRVIFGGS